MDTRIALVMSTALLMGSLSARGQIVVAHRGASFDAPENTLAAFELAWTQNSDGIEGDFYLTADEQIVCIHDKDTERTAGVKKMVEESTLEQLRQLEYGRWKGKAWQGEPIPTLEQVLRTVPAGKRFVIELKSKQQIVPVLADQLSRLDTSRISLLIISFDQPTVVQCKRLMPDIKVHWLTSFDKNVIGSGYHPTANEIAATVLNTGADGVGMKGDRKIIDTTFVQTLRSGGCKEFHVWTIDEVADAKYFQQLGAIGITTNRPDMIGAAIR